MVMVERKIDGDPRLLEMLEEINRTRDQAKCSPLTPSDVIFTDLKEELHLELDDNKLLCTNTTNLQKYLTELQLDRRNLYRRFLIIDMSGIGFIATDCLGVFSKINCDLQKKAGAVSGINLDARKKLGGVIFANLTDGSTEKLKETGLLAVFSTINTTPKK